MRNCFDYCFEVLQKSIHACIHMKVFLSVCRRLSGHPLSEHEIEIINKFFCGIHNKKPICKIVAPVNWDVKILLDYFEKLPNNNDLTLQELGGKLFLLMLVCSG